MQITTELIVGGITIIGGSVLLLYRLDLIQIGKKEKIVTITKCEAHKEIVNALNDVKKQQLVNNDLHAEHAEKLREGKDEFKSIKDTLTIIGQKVAILKDRSDREIRKNGGIVNDSN